MLSGDPITKISIPAADLKPTVVVEGTGASALRAGAGHYPNTPLPGEEGNVAIAGHRTTYGKPFANLDRLKIGDIDENRTAIGSALSSAVNRLRELKSKSKLVILMTDGQNNAGKIQSIVKGFRRVYRILSGHAVDYK